MANQITNEHDKRIEDKVKKEKSRIRLIPAIHLLPECTIACTVSVSRQVYFIQAFLLHVSLCSMELILENLIYLNDKSFLNLIGNIAN